MKRLLITGASGLLGSSVIPLAAPTYAVYGISRSGTIPLPPERQAHFDLCNHAQTRKYLDEIEPHFIVHCAAITDVELCEAEPKAAQMVNADVPGILAKWAGENDSFFVYISTDSVFDGESGFYREEDSPRPLNGYARSKWNGEIAVRCANPFALILRTNFYGWSPKQKPSMAEWMLNKLTRGEKLQAFSDVRFSPLLANDLARTIMQLLRCKAAGLIHVGASNCCSKYEFALHLADLFSYSRANVVPVSVQEMPFKAVRPKNTSLAVEKVSRLLGEKMPTLEEGLCRFRRLYESGYHGGLLTESSPHCEAAQSR
jgi:dTDP-4-dehydrorhamnose reductase